MIDWEKNFGELEKTIEQRGCEFARRRGWLEYKVVSPTARGFPDRMYARRGVVILVEWKKENEPPRPQQIKRHSELRDHGVTVHVLDNLEDAYRLFA